MPKDTKPKAKKTVSKKVTKSPVSKNTEVKHVSTAVKASATKKVTQVAKKVEKNSNALRWAVFLHGLLLTAMGIFAVFFPGMTILLFFMYYGIFAVFTGLIFLLIGLFNLKRPESIALVLFGLLDLFLGYLMLAKPLVVGEIMIFLFIFWMILVGALELIVGLRNFSMKNIVAGILETILGVVSIGAGIYFLDFIKDVQGGGLIFGLSFVIIAGIYAILTGMTQMLSSAFHK